MTTLKGTIAAGLLVIVTTGLADWIGGVGLVLSKDQEGAPPKVRAVVPGSPAGAAGVKTGGVLLSIDGTNTAGKTLVECVNLVNRVNF